MVDKLEDYDGMLNDDSGAYLRVGLLYRTDRVCREPGPPPRGMPRARRVGHPHIANGGDRDIVMLGDFNDELTDDVQWNVFNNFFDKSDEYTFLTLPAAQADEFSFITYESMIDHVLVTQDMLAEYGMGTTVVQPLEQTTSNYDAEISDHRPVTVTFTPQGYERP